MLISSRPLLNSDSSTKDEGNEHFSIFLIRFSSNQSLLIFLHSSNQVGTDCNPRFFNDMNFNVFNQRSLYRLYFIDFLSSFLAEPDTNMLQTLFKVLSSSSEGFNIYVLYLIILTVFFSSRKSLNSSIKIFIFSSINFDYILVNAKISSGICKMSSNKQERVDAEFDSLFFIFLEISTQSRPLKSKLDESIFRRIEG